MKPTKLLFYVVFSLVTVLILALALLSGSFQEESASKETRYSTDSARPNAVETATPDVSLQDSSAPDGQTSGTEVSEPQNLLREFLPLGRSGDPEKHSSLLNRIREIASTDPSGLRTTMIEIVEANPSLDIVFENLDYVAWLSTNDESNKILADTLERLRRSWSNLIPSNPNFNSWNQLPRGKSLSEALLPSDRLRSILLSHALIRALDGNRSGSTLHDNPKTDATAAPHNFSAIDSAFFQVLSHCASRKQRRTSEEYPFEVPEAWLSYVFKRLSPLKQDERAAEFARVVIRNSAYDVRLREEVSRKYSIVSSLEEVKKVASQNVGNRKVLESVLTQYMLREKGSLARSYKQLRDEMGEALEHRVLRASLPSAFRDSLFQTPISERDGVVQEIAQSFLLNERSSNRAQEIDKITLVFATDVYRALRGGYALVSTPKDGVLTEQHPMLKNLSPELHSQLASKMSSRENREQYNFKKGGPAVLIAESSASLAEVLSSIESYRLTLPRRIKQQDYWRGVHNVVHTIAHTRGREAYVTNEFWRLIHQWLSDVIKYCDSLGQDELLSERDNIAIRLRVVNTCLYRMHVTYGSRDVTRLSNYVKKSMRLVALMNANSNETEVSPEIAAFLDIHNRIVRSVNLD